MRNPARLWPLAIALALAPALPASDLVYIGSYTGSSGSKGIYAWRFDPATGDLKELGLMAETASPSFLAIDRSSKYLFAVNEIGDYQGEKAGAVTAFSMDRSSGKLTQLNQVSTQGDGPCDLAVDATGKMLIVANYGGGSVASFRIGPDGRLGAASSFIQHSGQGPNAARQEAPHAHCARVSPDNRYVFVNDLGLDRIFSYRIDPGAAKLSAGDPPFTQIEPGSGPRHLAFHPNHRFVYSINELRSTITVLQYEPRRGAFHEQQTISTLPADFHGASTTAEVAVHPNGRYVYGSNRGHDSIAVFSVDQGSGQLKLVQHVSTQGKTPRNFAIDSTGRWLFAANQDTNNVVLFRVDPASGKLTPSGGTFSSPKPVCVLFVKAL